MIIVLFSISQIMPWSSLKYMDEDMILFYSWGINSKTNSDIGSNFYLLIFFETLDAANKIPKDEWKSLHYLKIFAIGLLLLFLSWLISIIVIILSILAFYNLYTLKEDKMKKLVRDVAISSIIAIIIYYVSITFFLMDVMDAIKKFAYENISFLLNVSIKFSWSIGAFLFLSGTILSTGVAIFFASKDFQKRLLEKDKNHKPPHCQS